MDAEHLSIRHEVAFTKMHHNLELIVMDSEEGAEQFKRQISNVTLLMLADIPHIKSVRIAGK